jgi:outer membrane protein assembly factor BamB
MGAASPGQDGEYCRNGRSPILWKDPATGKLFLLSDITNKVRAFDAGTGKLLWTDGGPARMGREGAGSVVTPAVLTVGGTPVLWADSKSGDQECE